jgi:hypothetical protein
MMKFKVGMAMAVLGGLVLPMTASAQGGYVATDNIGYTGTQSCYATLADATARTNATCSNAVPQRDLSLYFVLNNPVFAGFPTYESSAAMFLTNWFAGGGSNPNNTSKGFLQMYDEGAGSVTAMSIAWQDPARTVLSLNASGGPTIPGCTTVPPQDCGRLWNGASSANGGTFNAWSISAVFSGLPSATWNPLTGVYESASNSFTVSGSINGVFTDAITGNYYAIDAVINNTSWAVDHGYAGAAVFGAPSTVTPEPVSMVLLGSGLAGIAGARRRRKAAKNAAV